MKYDYLIVGAGLFGATFAFEMNKLGKKCLIIEKRDHIAGNLYTKDMRDIQVHWYGAHIFHTSNKRVWDYVNQFGEFNHYINSPIAVYKKELYNLPFNMNTFSRMWGIRTPEEAREKIKSQISELGIENPQNLEEQALSLVGRDVYEKLVEGYTQKQWGRSCKELPAFIIKRLPLRFTYDNNYFNDPYQGIPKGGYTRLIERMLQGVEVRCGVTLQSFQEQNRDSYDNILYTGMLDEYFDYKLGHLEYRSLRFEQEELIGCDNYQGNAVVNYTEQEIPYTRIIEHKHFEFGTQPDTVITREYPVEWNVGDEPYYPVNDSKNEQLLAQYMELALQEEHTYFGGRLGQYRYYDMDKTIEEAWKLVEEVCCGYKKNTIE